MIEKRNPGSGNNFGVLPDNICENNPKIDILLNKRILISITKIV